MNSAMGKSHLSEEEIVGSLTRLGIDPTAETIELVRDAAVNVVPSEGGDDDVVRAAIAMTQQAEAAVPAVGVGEPLTISLCAFHVTAKSNLGSIEVTGLRAGSYWAEPGALVGNYEEEIRDEGREPLTIAVRLEDMDTDGLMPDKPGIEEPITTALMTTEEEVWERWEASDQGWRDSLAIVGSVRYDKPLAASVLYVVGRDSRLIRLADVVPRAAPEIDL